MAIPTFPQMQHCFRLVDEGKITAENFQTFLENPNKFFEDNGFPVTVDFGMSLVDMIAAGNYGWKNGDITVEHFPIVGSGTTDVKLRLITLGRDAKTTEVDAYIAGLNVESAKLEHLLAFGAKYPDKQREFPIVALGSGWVDSGGNRNVPYLDVDGSKRKLNLNWDDPTNDWNANCRFLVVS